jgi:branched-chain amino acid transport system ATP-binding protein
MLEVRGLTKQFGALRASDGIDFDVAEGETHAVIGPERRRQDHLHQPARGQPAARFGHGCASPAPTSPPFPRPRRARLGLARSFQITSVYPDFSVLQNVALAIQAHAGHSFRFWRDARSDPALIEPARKSSTILGLARKKPGSRGKSRARRAAAARGRRSRSPRRRACCCSTSRWPAWGSRNRSA